jgi:glycosyltransferase involved in cell wall biosynthesis
MKRIVLNLICKNESHIIGRMLASALPVLDMIVAVDTGSSDDTIELLEAFGATNNIPTYVYTRTFDNFSNSRNHALSMLIDRVVAAGWNLHDTWGLTADCDEIVCILPSFDKQALAADLLIARQRIGRETFTRQAMFRLSKQFKWQSPIHEELVSDDPTCTKKFDLNIEIIEEPVGASWKGDLFAKFMKYADTLAAYANEGHKNFRTIYFIGDSYNAAAGYCKNPSQARELYILAQKYFEEALPLETKSKEVRFMLHKKMAENRSALGDSWPSIKQDYLKAFDAHVFKAETMIRIIMHYMEEKQWRIGFLYARFCYNHFTQQLSAEGPRLYVDESIYQWRLLFYYYYFTYRMGRKKEAGKLYSKLKQRIKDNPQFFSDQDLIDIQARSPLLLPLANMKEWLQKKINRSSRRRSDNLLRAAYLKDQDKNNFKYVSS